MAQTPRCLLDGGPYKPPFGVCAIYSQSTVKLWQFKACPNRSYQSTEKKGFVSETPGADLDPKLPEPFRRMGFEELGRDENPKVHSQG